MIEDGGRIIRFVHLSGREQQVNDGQRGWSLVSLLVALDVNKHDQKIHFNINTLRIKTISLLLIFWYNSSNMSSYPSSERNGPSLLLWTEQHRQDQPKECNQQIVTIYDPLHHIMIHTVSPPPLPVSKWLDR